MFKEIILPLTMFLVLFFIESLGLFGESILAISVILLTVLTWLMMYHKRELLLFTIGVFFGVVIEIGLRFLGFQQVWKHDTLLGVPLWLPLVWAFGFVLITRLGIYIRSH